MCEQEAEANGRLFLHCKMATDLWNMFVRILGVNWTMPRTTFEVLTLTGKELGREDQRKIGGKMSLLAFGGHYGKKGMRSALKGGLAAPR
ncbi:hypothetical protein H5410_023091 [Solanum commersonii]|uniref:Uncharacterized protein n=1 Tax=Solanum commersonii TaxID=4109 RepID=A0A9J5ZGK7_SOLCO|nr:hypothetical protein H5410_023091 [Solanum commersonii]